MKKRLVFLSFVVAGLLAAIIFLPVADWLLAVVGWMQENPGISWIIFILLYVLASVLFLPGLILTLGAGFAFGVPVGFALVSIASVAAACAAFLIARFFTRSWAERKLKTMPKFQELDSAVGKKGWLIVLLTRLSPVFPFNIQNYAYGVTSVPFGHYALSSWIGMMPGTLLYVYLGSLAQDLSSLLVGELPESSFGPWLFYGGLAATLAVTIVVTHIATRALDVRLENTKLESTDLESTELVNQQAE